MPWLQPTAGAFRAPRVVAWVSGRNDWETCRQQLLTARTAAQVPYSGFGIAARALATHTVVRVVRTAAFLAVVLPNSRNSSCYAERFPPVPQGWMEYVLTGVSTLKGFGGCNDLIIRCRPERFPAAA